jgi:isopenicillin N synthase-like dioxygenase
MRLEESFSRDFVSQLASTGLAFLDISQITIEQINETFRTGADFFRSDIQEKMTCQLPLDTGYRPFGIEYSQKSAAPDEMESFSVCHRLGQGVLSSPKGASLRPMMLRLFDVIAPMVEDLTTHLANHLSNLPISDGLRGSFRKWSLLQLNYSRPSTTDVEYINELHEDGCLLTVMTVTGPGLELKTVHDAFVAVQPTDKLLFISGEILHLLSGGLVPAVYHRVRNARTLSERMSLLFFADMNPRLCTPWISNEINAGIDIGRRVLTNATRYGLTEWKAESGDSAAITPVPDQR